MKIKNKKVMNILQIDKIIDICERNNIRAKVNVPLLRIMKALAFNIDIDHNIITDCINTIITLLTGQYITKHNMQLVDLQESIQNRKLGYVPNFLPIVDSIAEDIYLLCDIYYKFQNMMG